MIEKSIHRLLMHSFSYEEGHGDINQSKLLYLAYMVDDGEIRVLDMSEVNGYLPGDLRKALRCPWTIKYAMNPAKERGTIRTYTGEIDPPSEENWIPFGKLMRSIGMPEDLHEAARLLHFEQSSPELEESCVKRFCKPDPVFGGTVNKREYPHQWSELKRISGWYVRTMMNVLWKFSKTVRPRIRFFRLRDSFRVVPVLMDEDLFRLYHWISEMRIGKAIQDYNEAVESDDPSGEEILYHAYKLKRVLETDFAELAGRIKENCYLHREVDADAMESRAEMIFRAAKLEENEELILMDYQNTTNTVLRWLADLKEEDDAKLEKWFEDLQISLWQVVNAGKRCICGKVKLRRKGFWLLITMPYGCGLTLMNPVFSCADKQWKLHCDEYRDGVKVNTEYTVQNLMNTLAEYTVEAYMAEFAERIVPRKQMLLCEGRKMLLKLEKRMLFHTRIPKDIRQKWWYGLSLKPDISYRMGGASYGE